MKNQLADFVDAGGLRLLRHESPWSRSPIRNEQDMDAAAEELDELVNITLQRSRRGMRRVIGQASLPEPRDLDGWQQVLQLLDDVRQTVQRFGSDIFGEQLTELYYATAPARERSANQRKLPWRQRRSLVKQLRGMCDNAIAKKKDLHAALVTVVEQRQRWREIGGPKARPAQVAELDAVLTDYAELRRRLAAVALSAKLQNPEQQPTEQMEHTLDELSGDRNMLLNLPRLHELLDVFATAGLSDLVDSIAERDADAAQAQRMFHHMWLRCLADEFALRSRALREFSADAQERVAEEFRTTDSEHVRTGASRVRRRVDIELRRACDEYPREKEVLRTEANKKARHLPMSKLVEKAGHVLLALRPCWAMSPLVVSRTLPAARMFDLVVFDEASQILPHDAVTSIMRGDRLVVAGDDRQLPPTDFFATALRNDEADQEESFADLADFESILSTVRPLLPTSYRLTWHYRSQDERLIEFSNNEVYDRELVTFPNRESTSPVRAEYVDGVASPGQGGSSEAEVQRVVKLVLEHAEWRPRESLGVIVWGNQHQQRIELAMRRATQDRPDLADFFSSDVDVNRRFFVKNLETVQGDERDAIILSIGVARQANGTVNRQGFGILNQEVGVRRVNVAVTRAKRRMTVVSAFPSSALEPSDRESGTEMLRRYLEFAERGGGITTVGRSVPVEFNAFERDVAGRLTANGIDVHPQWGVSGYRIDFALAHPDRPGQMVLAVEADGDRYHRASSTRDRDRLRQEHLERLGWRFHRVWASAWFAAPGAEVDKIVQAWKQAVTDVDSEPEPDPEPEREAPAEAPASRRVARPPVPPGLKTQEYAADQLVALCTWLISDDLQLDREERVDQALRELGFQRRGPRIVERLRWAVQIAQRRADDREA